VHKNVNMIEEQIILTYRLHLEQVVKIETLRPRNELKSIHVDGFPFPFHD